MNSQQSRTGKALPTFTVDLADRIKRVIDRIGTQKQAASLVGVRPETVAAWQKGMQKIPLLDMLTLCEAAGFSIEWLATGKEPRDSLVETSHVPMRTEQEHGELPMQMVDPRSLEEGAFVVLPLMDISAAAGSGRLSPDFPAVRSQVALSEDYLRSIGVPPRFAQLLEIDGDSMFPTLKDRDIAVVDTSILDVRSSAVYAVIYGGLVVAKRVQINRDGSILLSSDNKAAGYQDERVAPGDLQDLHIAGRIRGRLGGL